MAKPELNKKFKYRKNVTIGSLEAEKDRYLEDAFMDTGEYDILRDPENEKSIIIGRTGAGKSALIRLIESNEDNVVRLQPEAMSLKYLSNSDILSFLRKEGVNLDIFYKLLWKHVFIVEFMRMFPLRGINGKGLWWQNLLQYFSEEEKNKSKKRIAAIEYLEKFDGEFWEQTEVRIKMIEREVATKLAAELSTSPEALLNMIKGSLSGEKNSRVLEQYEFKHKAQKVISELQANAIYDVINFLKEDIFSVAQKKYFVIIDDLDKEWVDESIVYDLIKALVITINELKSIPGTKIVIALRDNLYEMTFEQTQSRGVQREKYKELNLNLKWHEEDLKELLQKRLDLLIKEEYTNRAPSVDDILPKESENKPSGFDYMIKRTLMRPRDLIAFFNKVIEQADGQTKITRQHITNAETEYSFDRLQAIEDEWYENFGPLAPLYEFLKNKSFRFEVDELDTLSLNYLYSLNNISQNSVAFKAKTLLETQGFYPAMQLIVSTLYRTGIIGAKLSAKDPIYYSFSSNKILSPTEIQLDSKFYVHYTFHRALSIKDHQSQAIVK